MSDVKKGDFITVVERIDGTRDNSYRGDCFEVESVDLPFLRLMRHDGFLRGKAATLNLEQYSVKSLSDEFVQSVIGRTYSLNVLGQLSWAIECLETDDWRAFTNNAEVKLRMAKAVLGAANGDKPDPVVQAFEDQTGELTAKLQGVANFLRGMTFDPRLHSEIAEACTYKSREIENYIEQVQGDWDE